MTRFGAGLTLGLVAAPVAYLLGGLLAGWIHERTSR